MPNGKIHDRITYVTTPIVGVLSYVILTDIKITIVLMFTYFFASIMFNGDLDTNSRPYNRWLILKMIWIPYQLMFIHRSIFTHGIIVGTVVRLIYLGIIPFIILLLKDNLDMLTMLDLHLMITIFIGLELGSAIHTISDILF